MSEGDGQSAAQGAKDLEAAKDLEGAADAQYKRAAQASRSSLALKTAVRGLAQQAEQVGPLTLELLANEAGTECSKGRAACETLRAASSELLQLKRHADRAHERAIANEAADAADADGPVRSTSRRAVRLGLFANNSRRIGDRLRAVVGLSDTANKRQETAEAVARSLNSRLQQAPTEQEQRVVLQALLHTTSTLWWIHQQGSQDSQGGAASQGETSQGNASQATTEAASDLTTEAAPGLGAVIDYARATGVRNEWSVREPVVNSIAAAALVVWQGNDSEHQAAADDHESGSPSERWDDVPAWTAGSTKQSCVDARLIDLFMRLGTDTATLDALMGGDTVPPTCTEGTLGRALEQFTALAGAEMEIPEVDEGVPRMNDTDDTDGHILSSSDLFTAAYWPRSLGTDAEAAEACKHLSEDYCYRNNQPGARPCGLCTRYCLFVPRVARLLECAPLQPHPSAFFRVNRGEEPAFPTAFFGTVAGLRALHSAAEACAAELASTGNSLLKQHRAKRSLKSHERCDCFGTAERIRELRNESHASCPTCWLTLPDVERPDWVEAAEGLHQQAHRGRH